MSTEPAPDPSKKKEPSADDAKSAQGFDPDSFRMTIGEHLEELRGRLVLALMGLSLAVLGCFFLGEKVITAFCAPLNKQLIKNNLPPQVYYADLTDPFMTYLKITLITAASIAGPWILYQIWLFVAAGLYPNERKMVTRYIPLSVTLFIVGLLFVYFLVLPLSINFFLAFSKTFGVNPTGPASVYKGDFKPVSIPVIPGNPPAEKLHAGDMWIDKEQNVLRVALDSTHIRSINFAPDSMMSPIITIGDYISLVITFMLTFGIAFQLPLVMLAVVSVGVVDIEFLKTKRKIIFFAMTVASAILAPGDIVTSMLALLIPLVLLYEFGLILVRLATKRKARAAAAEEAAAKAEGEK
jgi:sec-independent protein translocase protein TatC